MYIIANDSLPHAILPGIQHQTLAGSDNGLTGLSIWKQVMAPGNATPPHSHECEEVVVVTRGKGLLHIDGETHEIGANMTLIIPPNIEHQILSTGNEPMETLAAFSRTPVTARLPDGNLFALPWAT